MYHFLNLFKCSNPKYLKNVFSKIKQNKQYQKLTENDQIMKQKLILFSSVNNAN